MILCRVIKCWCVADKCRVDKCHSTDRLITLTVCVCSRSGVQTMNERSFFPSAFCHRKSVFCLSASLSLSLSLPLCNHLCRQTTRLFSHFQFIFSSSFFSLLKRQSTLKCGAMLILSSFASSCLHLHLHLLLSASLFLC